MKKRGLLSVIIVLLLTISMLGILLTANPPTTPLLLNSPSNYLNPTAKSYNGIGSQLNALLYITNNYNNVPNATNTTSNIYIPCPNDWKIVWANLTLSDINAPNVTIEPNASSPDDSLSLGFYAMSFQLTNNAYLDVVSVQLTVDTAGTANFYVYNATNDGSGVPKPQRSISTISSVSLSTGINYLKDVDFGHVLLNTSNTYNNNFFIAVEKTGTELIGRWRAITDSPSLPGAGHVYYWTGSAWSVEQSYDCKLRVNVSASTAPAESALPSEIGLTINGSQVSDISKGNGMWINSIASSVSTGYILYDVNSTWMSTVSFSYIWNVTYGKDTAAATNFDVSHNTAASWNVTVDATDAFLFTEYGFNHINITGIPSDWGNESSMAYNQTGTSWIELDSGPPQTISFRASNGTWVVNCTAPNYVEEITVINQGHNVTNIGAILVDNLTVNVTLDAFVSVSWDANLSIYNNSDGLLIFNVTTSGNANGSFSFPLTVLNDIGSPGDYNVTVFFHSSFEAGYMEIGSFPVSSSTGTRLTVLSSPDYVNPPGYGNVTVRLERTDINVGVSGMGANINVSDSGVERYDVVDNNSGVYFVLVNFTSEGYHTFRITVQGSPYYDYSASIDITVLYGVPPTPDVSFLLLSSVQSQVQSQRNMESMFLMFGLVGSVVAVGAGGFVANRRRKVPLKAMASLENIIVDHIATGITLWAFDFFRMDQDVTLVSGFMTAVKTFMSEMQKGGLRKLETEFGTFIREDGAFLAATCITSGNSPAEENWIRKRLRSFLSTAEQENFDALEKWKGDAAPFRKSFPAVLASVINLEKTEELQRQRILRLENEKEMLRAELNQLGAHMESLSKQVESKIISRAEFEARKARVEPEYDRVQNEYIRVSLFLSRAPSKLEAKRVKPEVTEDVEKIQERFLKIRMEIEELRRKEVDGTITSKDHKRRDKLHSELVELIEKLDKMQK